MAESISIQCRVQYLRKGEWVTISKDEGIVATIESDLVAEVERLKTLGREILKNLEESESLLSLEWTDEQFAKWKEELA